MNSEVNYIPEEDQDCFCVEPKNKIKCIVDIYGIKVEPIFNTDQTGSFSNKITRNTFFQEYTKKNMIGEA